MEASITTVASWLEIPISLALSTVMCLVGLGWGRATRSATATDLVRGDIETEISADAVTAEAGNGVPRIGAESAVDAQDLPQLFDPSTVVRFVAFWIIGPSLATGLSYLSFVLLEFVNYY
ncbi:MAG: hypothetical protein V5A62_14515 [Haloarculaceae archaeon]